jgi:flagellar hook protein FlgE
MALSFNAALSGLRANSDSISMTGNNIANANTTAFKSSSLNFGDVFTDSLNARQNGAGLSLQQGSGVRTAGSTTNFSQGTLNESSSPLNAAIQGNGFFVVKSDSGTQNYTRAGDFTPDREGYLLTPTGEKVQGYLAIDNVVPPEAPLTSLQIPLGTHATPIVTSEATLRMNLNATDAIGTEFHAPMQVYDSKGSAHTLDMVFTKTANDTYNIAATLDGLAAAVDSTTMTFDVNGQLVSPATLSVTPNPASLNGAALPVIAINLRETNPDGTLGASNITNFSATSAVVSTDQDGFGSGTLSGLSFGPKGDGTVLAVYSNGQTRVVGQVALATFNSQDGLRHMGNNLYGPTQSSGSPSIGSAATGGRGAVIGGVLEQSNVDIATEFTELIIAQRGFQANSRVITTINQTLQDVIQII